MDVNHTEINRLYRELKDELEEQLDNFGEFENSLRDINARIDLNEANFIENWDKLQEVIDNRIAELNEQITVQLEAFSDKVLTTLLAQLPEIFKNEKDGMKLNDDQRQKLKAELKVELTNEWKVELPNLLKAEVELQLPALLKNELDTRLPGLVKDEVTAQLPALVTGQLPDVVENQLPPLVTTNLTATLPGLLEEIMNRRLPTELDARLPGLIRTELNAFFPGTLRDELDELRRLITELENRPISRDELERMLRDMFEDESISSYTMEIVNIYRELTFMNSEYEERKEMLDAIRQRVYQTLYRQNPPRNGHLYFGSYDRFIQQIVVTLRATAPYNKNYVQALDQVTNADELAYIQVQGNEMVLFEKWSKLKKEYEGSIEYIKMTQLQLSHDVFAMVNARMDDMKDSTFQLLSDNYRTIIEQLILELNLRLQQTPRIDAPTWSQVLSNALSQKTNRTFVELEAELKDVKQRIRLKDRQIQLLNRERDGRLPEDATRGGSLVEELDNDEI